LKKGKAVNNWLLLLLIGSGIIFITLFLINSMFYFEEEVLVISIQLNILLGSLCASMVGAYMIKQAFKTALVLEVAGKGIKHTCRFNPETKLEQLHLLLSFLEKKCPGRLKVEQDRMLTQTSA
jgi:hypothetical protein